METWAKATLRTQVRAEVLRISPERRIQESANLCQQVRENPAWIAAKSVLLFSPLRDEPDIAALLEGLLNAGKVACFPRFNAASGVYCGAQISNRDELTIGKFGTLEPNADCPAVALNHLDLVLVPGIAFDLAGRRLGRGKGFYDRLLAEVRGHKCGVAFDVQIVAEIPEEPHDVRVNSIATPTRWHLAERAA